MNKIFLISICCVLFSTLIVAQSVGINNNAPHSSAALDITSDNKGLLIPRMTNAQRTVIVSPAQGLLVYQTEATEGFYYYDGASWNLLITKAGGMYNFGFTNAPVALGFNANTPTKVNFSVQNYLNNVTFTDATFTAPSTGIYSFNVNLTMYGNAAASVGMGFYVNNLGRSVGTFNIISGIFQNIGYTDNLLLNSGDQVSVQINPTQFIAGFAISFTGFKIN